MMTPDFNKAPDALVPAIIQDSSTGNVLMLGYMNAAAYRQTLSSGLVTFYSRSRQCLWTKGETSGNYLRLVSVQTDCDNDSLLVCATPAGPVCHTGTDSCFGNFDQATATFLPQLEAIIAQRKEQSDTTSYTASLFAKGINKIAQKVGEEAVELVIEAKDNNDDLFKNEAADLLFHYLVLLQAKGCRLSDIEAVLRDRHSK